ncbi:hypothetical protein B0H21DRAFT_712449 [Amylocystis lapponica]|nr:hypothetical protein B0H21DRAFT_712449 [Amylocystis lapponica]
MLVLPTTVLRFHVFMHELPYSDTWAVQPPSDPNLSSFFLQTYHVAQAQGATLNLSFTGSAIALFGFKGPGHIRVACGCPIMMFTIPNTGKLQRACQQLLFSISFTDFSSHFISLTDATGARGAWLDFDFVQITNESLSAAASTPVATGVLLWATPMHQHHSSEWLQETHPQIEWLHKILFGLAFPEAHAEHAVTNITDLHSFEPGYWLMLCWCLATWQDVLERARADRLFPDEDSIRLPTTQGTLPGQPVCFAKLARLNVRLGRTIDETILERTRGCREMKHRLRSDREHLRTESCMLRSQSRSAMAVSEAYACAAIDSFTLNFHLHVGPLDYSSVMPEGNYIAQLTEEPSRDQPFDCQRPNCTEKHFEPGTTEIHYIESANPSTEGIWVCDACNDYYGRKSGTVRRGDATTQAAPHRPGPSPTQHVRDIHRRTAQAQRGERGTPVAPLGEAFKPRAPLQQPRTSSSGTSGPRVNQLGWRSGQMLPPPPPLRHPPTPPLALPGRMPTGYTVAHREYADIRDAVLSSVTQGSVRESVILDVQLARRVPGLRTFKADQFAAEIVDWIPAKIGAGDLKVICWLAIQDKWIRRSQGFKLTIDDVILRNKHFAEIIPKQVDTDAISSDYYKKVAARGKGQPPVTKFVQGSRAANIYLEIPEDIYEKYQDHLEALEYARLSREAAEEEPEPVKRKGTRRGKGKARMDAPPPEASDSDDDLYSNDAVYHGNTISDSEFEQVQPVDTDLSYVSVMAKRPLEPSSPPAPSQPPKSPVTPPRKRQHQADFTSPDASHLAAALRSQGRPTDAGVHSLYRCIDFLINSQHQVNGSDPIAHQDLEHLGDPKIAQITLDPEGAKNGSFKKALFGTSTEPLFRSHKNPGSKHPLCAKQTYYTGNKGSLLPYDSRKQARLLFVEVKCLVWADLLLRLVYDFIRRECAKRGKPSFDIPQFRYIEAALAKEGVFRKYINNEHAVPLKLRHPEDTVLAEFLAFTQHVQYWKTQKIAFITDYQDISAMYSQMEICPLHMPPSRRTIDAMHFANTSRFQQTMMPGLFQTYFVLLERRIT